MKNNEPVDHQESNKQMNSTSEDVSVKDTSLLVLYLAFFRIGLFTFGGGYAMLPMLLKEVVSKYRWATEKELLNYFAISQSTPGIIAVNTATFIGMKTKGTRGAIAATIGVVSPSWLVISIIAMFLDLVRYNVYVEKAFMGIRVIVVALIIHSVIKMGKKTLKTFSDILLFSAGFLLVATKWVAPIYVILTGAIIGIVFLSIKEVSSSGTS